MLLDAILKLHDKIQNMKLGVNREREIEEIERARLRRLPLTAGAGHHHGPGAGGPLLAAGRQGHPEEVQEQPGDYL
jgi:hypothetical protein